MVTLLGEMFEVGGRWAEGSEREREELRLGTGRRGSEVPLCFAWGLGPLGVLVTSVLVVSSLWGTLHARDRHQGVVVSRQEFPRNNERSALYWVENCLVCPLKKGIRVYLAAYREPEWS